MPNNSAFRRCLEELDVAGMRAVWAEENPHLHQPKSDYETLVTMHMARTQCAILPLKFRAYSHRWLLDNGHDSLLPDPLKPKAERLYPVVVEAVGISVNFKSPILKPIGDHVRQAMEHAVLECFADDERDPVKVKARMMEMKTRATKKLVGLIT